MLIQYSTPSLVAVATGIAGSAWGAGAIASITLASIPAFKAVPQSPAYIWQIMFELGKSIMPKIAATTAISYLYAAYDTRNLGGNWKGYVFAALSVICIVPFTLTAMAPTNNALISAANGSSTLSTAQVSELIHTWGGFNLVRSLFPLVGTIAGFVTFLSNVH